MKYDVQSIERKWQDYWKKNPYWATKPTGDGKKYYCLDMFPYPSGSGLHVGHWRGYVLSDVYARIKWHDGYNVLHPMGWDAFGLPAENDAIKKGIQPAVSTAQNIATFKKQLAQIAAIYDWSKEVNTTDPHYYKWTQWIFLKMFNAGLAYQADMPINWCPSCLTGLANEEVVNGGCERCGTQVEERKIRQWVLKITEYAEKLLTGLDKLEWPEKVKAMQRNWIGKSYGVDIFFQVQGNDGKQYELPAYTTTPETICGVTFIVVAPDHEIVDKIVQQEQRQALAEYQKEIQQLSAVERTDEHKNKTGIFTGAYAINPVTHTKIPVYVASYVLKEYGTGIVMGVPAHDQRDFDFAKTYALSIKQVIDSPLIKFDTVGNILQAYEGDGKLIESEQFNGLDAQTIGRERVSDYLVAQGFGKRRILYKLRDWIFSRQRYWGEPIPLIHCAKCGIVPVPENELPVELPEVEKYQPTGTGESPLAAIEWWVNVPCPQCAAPAKRETNTMPQWAGSCWYFLRYPNPELENKPWTQEDMHYWLPVDLYVGGIEHAILHLLYARFYVKVLYDLDYLPFDEPFLHLFNQGMVLKYSDKTGAVEKMSKSKGNVVSPDEMVSRYGSDVLRMYILFMGPPELDCEWQDAGVEGINRFMHRLWIYLTDPKTLLAANQHEDKTVSKHIHQFLKIFQERIALFKPNTALAACMEWLNEATRNNMQLSHDSLEKILVTLSILAPHMASELLERLLNVKLQDCSWPKFDPALAQQDEVTVAVQVNGKTRGTVAVKPDSNEELIVALARTEAAKWLEDKAVVKIIFVQNRMVNFVIK